MAVFPGLGPTKQRTRNKETRKKKKSIETGIETETRLKKRGEQDPLRLALGSNITTRG